jgi:Tol biopolymer transport system component
MSGRSTDLRVDPIIAQWLASGPEVGPEHGLQRALAATRKVQQRPGWTFASWWLPAGAAGLDLRVSRTQALALLVVATLAVLAVAASLAGTFLQPNPTSSPAPPVEQGNLIAYQEGPPITGSGHVTFLARPDGSARRPLTRIVPFSRLPVFSPDGQRVVFLSPSSERTRDGRLLVVRIDGTGQLVQVDGGIQSLPADVPQVSWSPDGSRIAFAGTLDGISTIFVTPSDGSAAPVAITDASAHRNSPTWSPDGAWIAFRERDLDGVRTRLRRASPDGATVEEITLVVADDAYLSRVRWREADGPMAYWYNPGFGSETSAYIDLLFTHKNEPWRGTPGGSWDSGVTWAPDGSKIAFLTQDEGVVIADFDPTEPYDGRVVSLGPVADCWVDWAPTGDALYGGAPGGCNGVVVIPLADPGAATTIPGSTAGVASWQPLPE